MARREYGGSLTDFTTDKAGLIRRGLDAYFWATRTGGTPLTDIVPVGTAGTFAGNKYTSGTVGAIDILGPDGYDADGIWTSPDPNPATARLWLRSLDIKGTGGSSGGGGGGTVGDATSTTKGVIQLTGDLGGTAASPTITKVFTKTDVGLGNVDNTADAAKPISTATATALAAKADLVGGLVPTAQIPALALTNTVAVTNQAAMLALTATQVQPGDIAVRSDGAGTFVLVATDPSQLSSWLRLNSPTDLVTSVNGQQGTVLLGKTDVGLGNVDNVAAASLRDRATHTGTQAATTITGLAPVATSGTKIDVGLGNVDNTSDANKPVSTAQATAFGLAPTAIKTAAYAVAAGELALMNVAAGATTLSLPATPPDKTRIAARAIGATNTTPLTMTASGADTIGDAGATSATVQLPGETIVLQYQAASTRWLATGNVKSLASLDARYPLLGTGGKVATSQIDTAGIAADSALTAAYAQKPSGGTDGQALVKAGSSTAWATISGGGTVADATTTTKGLVQLAGDLAGTAASPTVAKLAGLAPEAFQQTLAVVATVTAAATLAGDRHTPLDASGGAFTVTLPTPTRIGQQVRAEKIDTGTNVITVSGTLRGVTDTVSLRFTSEVRTFVAESLTSWRVASGNTPKAGFDTVYAQLGTVLRPITGETAAACATRIQAALDATSAVTLAGGDFTPSEPLRLNTGQQLTLWNARVIRQDNGATSGSFNSQVLVNKNPNATGNTDIRVRGIGRASLLCAPELLTTTKRNPDTSNGRPRLWENIGVAFVNASKVRVEGVQIGPVNAFAGNTQLCSDVIWSDIELAQPGSVDNQDGIDVGPGCSDIHIRRVTGTTGDDFCSIYAQTTSGSIEQTYVRPYLLAQATRANITNLFIKQCSVAPGLTSGNMFRLQAGDGATLTRVFIDSIEVLGTTAQTFMEMGPTAYITTAPATADLAGIEIRNVSGRFPRFLSLDTPCSNIAAANITHSAGTFIEVIGFQITNAHACSNISVDGVRVLPTTAGGTLVHLRSAAATSKVSVKNAYLGYATALLNDEFGNTGIHLDDIKVGVLAGVPFQVKAATAGTIASVAWDQATAAVTAIHTGGASTLRFGALMPALTSADTTPAPVFGSWLLCEASKNPTGDAVSGAGMYLGGGTAWTRVSTLSGDTQAPSVPGTPTATGNTQKIDLIWGASTDNVAVTGYRVYRSDAPTTAIGTTASTSYSDTTAAVGTAYTYTVSAYDAAGNDSGKSASSNSATATAPSGTTTYSADTFTRTSSTSPGSTETGGYAWTAMVAADQAKWATNGTRLSKAAGNALSATKGLVIDDARSDGTVQVTFVSAVASTSGLLFRIATDGQSGFMFDRDASAIYRLRTLSGTAFTPVWSQTTGTGAAGDVVKVVLSGSSMTFYVNGTQLTTYTSSTNLTSTRHGVWAGSDPSTTSYDDWSHTSATT